MLLLDSPLTDLPGCGSRTAAKLADLGLLTVADLIEHYPRRHEDRRDLAGFPTRETDGPVFVHGLVTSTAFRGRRPREMFEVEIRPHAPHALSPRLLARWFGMRYLSNLLHSGLRVFLFGQIVRRGRDLVLFHPELEILEPADDPSAASAVSPHFGRIVPVHRATKGLSPRQLRSLVAHALAGLDPALPPNLLPPNHSNLSRHQALQQLHFPDDFPALANARRHCVLVEFLRLQMVVAARRAAISSHPAAVRGPRPGTPRPLLDSFLNNLPFQPTRAQMRSINEIAADLSAPRPMHRLLQGDVGSGKTLVAFAAVLLAAQTGHQSALMAPTQILAEQHFQRATAWLAPLGLRIALRTALHRLDNSAPVPHLLIGTHALLFPDKSASSAVPIQELPLHPSSANPLNSAKFPAPPPPDRGLGLVIVDEQHKFGVLQRARLRALSGDNGPGPDLLAMTATPIPRSLAITAYGDLDLSILDEIPPGRTPIVTALRSPDALPKITTFLRSELDASRQIYLVHPLVNPSESTVPGAAERKSAVAQLHHWSRELAPHPCALLHGGLPPEQKEQIMRDFAAARISVLVATTVIEVGLDVPNATVMLIENAERFGLAQLHQLRGRVGRGQQKSWCILLADLEKLKKEGQSAALQKLETLVSTTDGFHIAETDLLLRGAGDILGTAQSGLPPIRIGDLVADADLMHQAREIALRIFKKDPNLEKPENHPWRPYLDARNHIFPENS